MMKGLMVVALCAPMLVMACGDDGGGSSGPAVQQLYAIQERGARFACGCYVEAGEAPSVDACLAETYDPPPQAFVTCLSDFVEARPTERAYVQCYNRELNKFLSCAQGQGCSIVIGERFQCADGTESVPKSFQCDDEDDCADGSDEVGCVDFVCGEESYPQSYVCDAFEDCTDGSDEVGCEATTAPCGDIETVAETACGPAPESLNAQAVACQTDDNTTAVQ